MGVTRPCTGVACKYRGVNTQGQGQASTTRDEAENECPTSRPSKEQSVLTNSAEVLSSTGPSLPTGAISSLVLPITGPLLASSLLFSGITSQINCLQPCLCLGSAFRETQTRTYTQWLCIQLPSVITCGAELESPHYLLVHIHSAELC